MMQPEISVAIAICKAVAGGNCAHLAAMQNLRDALTAAQDRNAELERLLGMRLDVPLAIKVPPYPAKILGILLATAAWVSIETLETALYGHLPDCDWPREPRKAIKVHVRHLRDRLDPHGIVIDTIFAAVNSGGYYLPPDMKAKARKLLGIVR